MAKITIKYSSRWPPTMQAESAGRMAISPVES